MSKEIYELAQLQGKAREKALKAMKTVALYKGWEDDIREGGIFIGVEITDFNASDKGYNFCNFTCLYPTKQIAERIITMLNDGEIYEAAKKHLENYCAKTWRILKEAISEWLLYDLQQEYQWRISEEAILYYSQTDRFDKEGNRLPDNWFEKTNLPIKI